MFEQLMKYPIDIFRRGDFYFGIRLPGLILFFIFVALIAGSIWAYRTTIARTNRRFRGFLIFLRSVALCGLAFCLLKPFVTIYQTRPDDSYLLLLVDQSKSMQIADSANKESRLNRVNRLLFQPEGGLIQKLNAKFKIRLFAFDANVKRIGPSEITQANGENTNIPASLNEALEDLKGVPLSGAVIFSDGADQSGEDITKLAFRLRDRKLPVHTVGVGSAKGIKDLELVKIDAPRTAEEDFPVEIWATVSRKGYDKRTVTMQLTDENRVIKTLPVELD
ncbi:VWA domain-containing protein, partial [Candidatus Poribacteria bacterium]|nr:VWA domain-containing protein [Candidatus Poribacteria bacterium]